MLEMTGKLMYSLEHSKTTLKSSENLRRKKLYNTMIKIFRLCQGIFSLIQTRAMPIGVVISPQGRMQKKFSREVEKNLNAADILNTLVTGYSKKWNVEYPAYHDISNFLQQSRRNLALFLHHDAITGTSKEYVMQDYENKLFHSFNATQKVISKSAQFLISGGNSEVPLILEPEEVKTSYDSVTKKQVLHVTKTGVPVILFNSLAKARVELTSVLVDTDKVIVKTRDHEEIPYQLNPVWQNSASVHQSQFEIIFLKKLAALSLDVVYLVRVEEGEEIKSVYPAKISIFNSLQLNIAPELIFEKEEPKYSGNHQSNISLENEYLRAEFDPKTGLLKCLKDKRTGNTTRIDLTFMQYRSQGSGAYLFYPNGEARPLHLGIPIIHVMEGPFMSQIEKIYKSQSVHVLVTCNISSHFTSGHFTFNSRLPNHQSSFSFIFFHS